MLLKKLREHPIELPTERKFGLFFAFVFAAVATYLAIFHGIGKLVILFFVLALIFLAAALIRPDMLRTLNKSWAYLGLILGMIVSPIVLGLIYFGMFTPIAALLRLKGRDELKLKKSSSDSFWVIRDPVGPEPDSFKNQY